MSVHCNYGVGSAQPLHRRCLDLLRGETLKPVWKSTEEKKKRRRRHTTNLWCWVSAFAKESTKARVAKRPRKKRPLLWRFTQLLEAPIVLLSSSFSSEVIVCCLHCIMLLLFMQRKYRHSHVRTHKEHVESQQDWKTLGSIV